MSDSSAPVPPCNSTTCRCYREQSDLTQELFNSPDPHIRIIAHMSSRQLSLVESMNNVQLTQHGLIQAVNGLRADMTKGFRIVGERISTLQTDHGVVEEVVEEDDEAPQSVAASIVGTIPPKRQP